MTLLESISSGFTSILNSIKAGFDDLKTAMANKADLETKVVELTATITRQEQEIAGFKADIAAKAGLPGIVAKLETDLASANAEIATLKADQKSVGERAAEITAAQGVKPNSIPGTLPNGSVTDQISGLRERLKTANASEKYDISMQIKELLTPKKK